MTRWIFFLVDQSEVGLAAVECHDPIYRPSNIQWAMGMQRGELLALHHSYPQQAFARCRYM